MHKLHHTRPTHSISKTRLLLGTALFLAFAAVWLFRYLVYTSWTLAALRALWRREAASFILSDQHDGFDVTFASYSRDQLSAAPYDDVVPPILHHIALGKREEEGHWRKEWENTVESCVDWHPGWQAHLWTDDTAANFVARRFPELKDVWDGYKYPVERIDALRYMVLYEYGGVILDMDLKCKRALGPLRRFDFVAPEAHPTGFSVGFMMAGKKNAFIGDVVRNLTVYNKHWLGLPYPTVMFSTGCHFASVIHAYQSDRSGLKILPGPLHSLNGRASTPIFDHLGSSSWHSYDAHLITTLAGKVNTLFCLGAIALALFALRRRLTRRRRV